MNAPAEMNARGWRRSRRELIVALALAGCGGVVVPQRDSGSHDASIEMADADPMLSAVDAAVPVPTTDAAEEFFAPVPTYGNVPPPHQDW